jgi:hypothetical protein
MKMLHKLLAFALDPGIVNRRMIRADPGSPRLCEMPVERQTFLLFEFEPVAMGW